MSTYKVYVKTHILPHGEGLPLPAYQTAGSSGMDLYAAIPEDTTIFLRAFGGFSYIPCGFKASLPPGMEAQIRPRSGLARKHGIAVLNAPGTIDSDYRGEWGVVLINHGPLPFEIPRGMRIAQAVFATTVRCVLAPCFTLDETSRGEDGFGSTGKGLPGTDPD